MRLRVATAPPSGAAPDPHPREVVWRDDDGRVAAYGSSAGSRHLMRMPGVAVFTWRDGSDEVVALPGEADPPSQGAGGDELVDAFYRCVLPMAMHTRGLQVLHASAVLGPAGVIALCARSGTGKSTLAYGLNLRPGHLMCADDALGFDPAGPVVQALPLPFTLHLRQDSMAYFRPQPVERGGAPEPARLAAVVVMARGADDAVRRLTDTDAFTAVLEHAYCFDLESRPRRRETAERYLDLTARVPVFELRFRAGLDRLPTVLDALEQIEAEA
jgi:hypothetical protein